MNQKFITLFLSFLSTGVFVSGWSIDRLPSTTLDSAASYQPVSTRRRFAISTASIFSLVVDPFLANGVPTNKVDEALQEMRLSNEKLAAIPDLLEEKEWDKVRSILKLPPVNKLWNLGDVRNIP